MLCGLSGPLSAQELTAFESIQWQKLEQDNPDLFGLFAATDPAMTADKLDKMKARLEALITRYREDDKFARAKPAKKIKTLYKETHDTFLVKYNLVNKFSHIFTTGEYNCVSATALYALIFDGLDIPYQIKQKPTHVYLLAYPQGDNILVETTDPVGGYVEFSGSFKADYIDNLTQAKLISAEERRQESVESLFDKHYFLDENISLQQLAGLQYANEAVFAMEGNDHATALSELSKAYSLYPSPQYEPLLIGLCVEMLYQLPYDDLSSVDYLVQLSRLDSTIVTTEMLFGEFARIANNYLVEHNDPDGLAAWCEKINRELDDAALLEEINYHHDYERGRLLYNAGSYRKALPYFEKCHHQKPDNVDVHQAVVESVRQILIAMPDQTLASDSLEGFARRMPALRENNHFKSMLTNSYLYNFMFQYDLENAAGGEKYKALFVEHMEPGLQVDTGNIGRAYAIAATYYYRRGNKRKALELINEGLEFAPNHRELMVRKQMIR